MNLILKQNPIAIMFIPNMAQNFYSVECYVNSAGNSSSNSSIASENRRFVDAGFEEGGCTYRDGFLEIANAKCDEDMVIASRRTEWC